MTEERKIFDVKEQKTNDVLAAVKVITPAISTIREWGKADRELLKVKTEINKLQKEIKAIDAVLEIFPDNSITEVLKEEREQRSKRCTELNQRKEQLEQTCADLMNEIIEYQEYAKIFCWINEDIINFLFEEVSSKECQDLYATVFFVDNCSKNREQVLEAFNNYFPDKKGISKALAENKVLRYLKSH